MPCGKKKHSNAASQSHRATGPVVAIDETVLRLRTATTNNSDKSHRPSSRRRPLVGLALIGEPGLSFMVSGSLECCDKHGPLSLRYSITRKVGAFLMTAILRRAIARQGARRPCTRYYLLTRFPELGSSRSPWLLTSWTRGKHGTDRHRRSPRNPCRFEISKRLP